MERGHQSTSGPGIRLDGGYHRPVCIETVVGPLHHFLVEGVGPTTTTNARWFTHEMAARIDDVAKADETQKKWLLMKKTWFKDTKHLCGMTKGPPRHKETWWWNRDVGAKRKVCHKAWLKSKSAEDKRILDVTKKEVCTDVLAAQESKLQELTADLQSEYGRKNCFMIARQMAREGRDVISVSSKKNNVGNVVSVAEGHHIVSSNYLLPHRSVHA